MKPYNRVIVAARLKELREGRGWTQNEMGEKLNALMGCKVLAVNDGGMELGGKTGAETVSQLESVKSKRNINNNLAFAYAEIFNVSLDYIYGRSDDKKPEYGTIKGITGFSDDSVEVLERTKSRMLWNEDFNIIDYMIKSKALIDICDKIFDGSLSIWERTRLSNVYKKTKSLSSQIVIDEINYNKWKISRAVEKLVENVMTNGLFPLYEKKFGHKYNALVEEYCEDLSDKEKLADMQEILLEVQRAINDEFIGELLRCQTGKTYRKKEASPNGKHNET